jgi:hypothetical protein
MAFRRRKLLGAMGLAAGAAALQPFATLRTSAQPRTDRSTSAMTARIAADLERHASFGLKRSAGPGDWQTADWIAERLRASGYEVERSVFDAPFFVERAAQLSSGSASVRVVPQAPVAVTPRAGITAPLALVPEDVGNDLGHVRGRIALVITPSARHAALFAERGIGLTVTRTAAAGAAAIVLVTMGPSNEAVALNAREHGAFGPVPMAILAPKDAAPFVAEARAGATARLVVDGDATHRPSPNVIGRVMRGDRWLALSTPRSGWYGCVAERGTGTAAFLELADWAVERFPEHSIFVMNTGGHEYFFAGSHRVLDEAPPPERTFAWAHIGATLAARDAEQRDGRWVMLDTVDRERRTMATAAARAATIEGFRGLVGLEQPGEVVANAGELSSFTDRGFESAFAVIGVHRWFHTLEDTLERVHAPLVTPVVTAHARTIELLEERGA